MSRLHFRIGKEGPPCGHGLFCYHNDPDMAEGLIRLWREWTLWWAWTKSGIRERIVATPEQQKEEA